ncbi:hypothetical protein [Streptomyces erythrochromogenes]|uniref:hypothetical protein n=1 Tax=Streptomyces erythrochromogenes TaxID=285574 RepID=UPI0038241231
MIRRRRGRWRGPDLPSGRRALRPAPLFPGLRRLTDRFTARAAARLPAAGPDPGRAGRDEGAILPVADGAPAARPGSRRPHRAIGLLEMSSTTGTAILNRTFAVRAH